ncbi:hypothetical protein AAG906_011504 [Vitis piasezkii]
MGLFKFTTWLWKFRVLGRRKVGLLQLKASINHPNGTALSSWEGVVLECLLLLPFQQLQILDLSWNYLTGIQGLLRLKKLRVLNVGLNDLTTIPILSALPSLEVLDLSYNYINSSQLQGWNSLMGGIPPIIGTLGYLKALSLGYNNLNDSFSMEGLCKLNLEELDLSYNGFEGSLPACLNNLTSLRLLDLSRNDFRGTIPSSLLQSEGSIYFGSLFNHSRLEVFELSSNNKYLKVEIENPTWSLPLFQLKILQLSNCTLNWPSQVVPSFLLSQYDLRVVDFGYNNMTGKVPTWLLANNTKLEYLSFESNSLTGVLDLGSSSIHYHMRLLDFSLNCIHGELPPFIGSIFPRLEVLNLSGNALQGNIPSSMGDMEQLGSLDLSNNNLSGQLPEHVMMSCISLEVLKLSNNSFHDTLPTKSSLIQLLSLETLILSRNYLDGYLSHNKIGPNPSSLCQSNKHEVLHLESNELTGPIPHVLAEATSLFTFKIEGSSLKGNQLEDSIPLHLCQLKSISILDLSHNRLSGSIPPCLDNITFGREVALIDDTFFMDGFRSGWDGPIETYSYESQIFGYAYMEINFKTSAERNKLTGPIPPEIGNLSGIHTLNLSYNQLIGSIPQTFSNLKEIESLDLSHNGLTGQIPPQMVELNFLTVFTVAHNNLSGKTPERKFQFATFGQSSYEGNPLLCGLPLEQSCTPTSAPPAVKPPVSDNKENSSWETIFLWSFGGSYGVAFLGIFAFLYLNSYYRELLFISLESMSLFFD